MKIFSPASVGLFFALIFRFTLRVVNTALQKHQNIINLIANYSTPKTQAKKQF